MEVTPHEIKNKMNNMPWETAVVLYSLTPKSGAATMPLAIEMTDEESSVLYVATPVEENTIPTKKILTALGLMVSGLAVLYAGEALISVIILIIGAIYSLSILRDDVFDLQVINDVLDSRVAFKRRDDFIDEVSADYNIHVISNASEDKQKSYGVVQKVFDKSLCSGKIEWTGAQQVAAAVNQFGDEYMKEVSR